MSYSENVLFDAGVNHFHNLELNKEIRVFHLGFCLWYIAKRVNPSSMECDESVVIFFVKYSSTRLIFMFSLRLWGHKVESYTMWHQSPESGGSHYLNSSPDLNLNLVLKLLEIKSPRDRPSLSNNLKKIFLKIVDVFTCFKIKRRIFSLLLTCPNQALPAAAGANFCKL